MMHTGNRLTYIFFVELSLMTFSSLHESAVKLSPHQLKHSLEQRWSPGKSSSKSRMTLEDFEYLAMPIYLKTIKRFP